MKANEMVHPFGRDVGRMYDSALSRWLIFWVCGYIGHTTATGKRPTMGGQNNNPNK